MSVQGLTEVGQLAASLGTPTRWLGQARPVWRGMRLSHDDGLDKGAKDSITYKWWTLRQMACIKHNPYMTLFLTQLHFQNKICMTCYPKDWDS